MRYVKIGEFMIKQVIGSSFKLLNAGWKSYCTVKMAEKTRMTYPEILYYKDVVKDCSQFYSKKISLFLKEKARAKKAARLAKSVQQAQAQNNAVAVVETAKQRTLGIA